MNAEEIAKFCALPQDEQKKLLAMATQNRPSRRALTSQSANQQVTPGVGASTGAPTFVESEIRALRGEISELRSERAEDKENIEKLANALKKKRDASSDGSSGAVKSKKSRKKRRGGRKSQIKKILSGPREDLSDGQKIARKTLQSLMKLEMCKKAEIPTTDGKMPRPEVSGVKRINEHIVHVIPDLSKEVGYSTNARLIQQAFLSAKSIISNDIEGNLTGVKDAAYTDDDMREFGKDVFREWRRTYRAETDPVEEQKLLRRKKNQVRTQRMRQKKNDRLGTTSVYKERYGVDPENLILTDYMSMLESELDTESEAKKAEHKKTVQEAAKLTELQIKHKMKVFEVIKRNFRSEELNEIYERLDDISIELKVKGGRSNPTVPRVDLGRNDNSIPEASVYPFMINQGWFDTYIKESGLENQLKVKKKDPAGFGSRIGEEPSSESDNESGDDSGYDEDGEDGQDEAAGGVNYAPPYDPDGDLYADD